MLNCLAKLWPTKFVAQGLVNFIRILLHSGIIKKIRYDKSFNHFIYNNNDHNLHQ
jgi:hypothetical protein